MPQNASDLVLRILGLASMFYVPQDIFSDTIARSHLPSDARILAEEFGGPTVLWGGAWLLISLAVIALTLRFGLGQTSNLRLSGEGPGCRRDATAPLIDSALVSPAAP